MEIKVLLCNCKGLCDSFKEADMNTLPFAVESDLDVKYSVLHPQLCGQGGNAVLGDVFKSADPETYVDSPDVRWQHWLISGCDPRKEDQLLGDDSGSPH